MPALRKKQDPVARYGELARERSEVDREMIAAGQAFNDATTRLMALDVVAAKQIKGEPAPRPGTYRDQLSEAQATRQRSGDDGPLEAVTQRIASELEAIRGNRAQMALLMASRTQVEGEMRQLVNTERPAFVALAEEASDELQAAREEASRALLAVAAKIQKARSRWAFVFREGDPRFTVPELDGLIFQFTQHCNTSVRPRAAGMPARDPLDGDFERDGFEIYDAT